MAEQAVEPERVPEAQVSEAGASAPGDNVTQIDADKAPAAATDAKRASADTSTDTGINTSGGSRRKFYHQLRFFRPLLRFLLMVVVPLVAAVYGAIWWGESMQYVTTENAYIKADVVAISADVSGRVIEINSRENHRVSAGEVLFRIDPRPFEIEIAEAKAVLDRVRSEIESIRADYRSGLRAVRSHDERVRYLKGEYQRQQKLTKRGVGTGAKLDAARHDLEMAKRQVETAKESNRMLLAELLGAPGIKVSDHPKYLAALADLDRAELDFDRTTVVAASDGIVGNISLQLGEYVKSGAPMFSLVQIDNIWIEANLKETQLTHIETGQAVTFFVDSYPKIEWRAKIDSIAPATGAEFSLLPPQNASGNWVKVVQRIPVRISVEIVPGRPQLRAGMTATISIDTGRDRSLSIMARELADWLGLEGTVPEAWFARLDS